MLETSRDLLYVVLAFCILWFTVFLCWILYQAARVLRNANRIVESLTEKLELISDAVQFIRKKVDGLSNSMGMVSSLVGGLADKFIMGKLSSKLDEKVSKAKKKTLRRAQGKTKKKK